MVLARTAVDKTGLTGLYDVNSDIVPDKPPEALPPPMPRQRSMPRIQFILAALQEQLYLRQGSIKGPVKVIVGDHAECCHELARPVRPLRALDP